MSPCTHYTIYAFRSPYLLAIFNSATAEVMVPTSLMCIWQVYIPIWSLVNVEIINSWPSPTSMLFLNHWKTWVPSLTSHDRTTSTPASLTPPIGC